MMRRRARNSTLVLGAFLLTFLLVPGGAPAKPSEKPFEIVPGSFHMVPSTVRAGAHEDLTTSFDFAHSAAGRTFNDPRNVIVNVPAGFTANNTAVPTCKDSQLLAINTSVEGLGGTPANSCPPASQVGTITLDLNFSAGSEVQRDTFPVYNMEVTSFGVTAELGFKAAYITQIMPVSVRPGDDGLTVTAPDIERLGDPNDISVTIWGLPAAKIHDAERGRECYPETTFLHVECKYGGEEVNIPVKPFLSMPTSCGSFTATMRANSWEAPGNWSEASDEIGPVAECERIHFDPAIETNLSTRSAESPTGLDVSLVVPQYWENSVAPASSNLKDASVALPEGVTINPSAGSGLGACTPQQYEAETSGSLPGEGCPPESKIGSIDIETPLLAEKIPGAIYIAKPFDNPFHSLLALYVLAKDPARGILVKVAGKIEPNPVTGQLVTTFDDNPQQPFNRFRLKFRPGATAPLVSPPACGTYTTKAGLTPWSAPGEPRLVSSAFEITQGVREGPCPSGGVPPFKPQVISGTQNNDGGSYSPFYLRVLREDGEQELTKFTTVLPPGLTGNLSGIPFCPEANIEAARHTSGTRQIEDPSCPAASEIGHTIVGAGVGTVLAQTPGKIYLAGPYHGSALSIVSVTSATVGPFDLGTVVIRFALRINPVTAQAEVDSAGSDPIPHIIEGIVVHVREIRVYMDRPKFILNPTNCNPMQITDVITGAGADFTNPADGDPVNVKTPFQAADCSSLAFKPAFRVTTSGRTSRKNGASLSVKLTYPKAPEGSQANIRSVKVDLPKQLPSRLTTLQKACPDNVFGVNPAACPATSIVGHAQANTPILPVPIAGPAYFVSHGGAKFPELIIVLQGYGITIDLHGETSISKAGITSSTFRTIPDNPIGSFQLTLPQGSNSALAANGNLCTVTKLAMPTSFVAQNGAVIHTNTPIVPTGCPKHVRHVRKKNLQKKK